MPWWHIGLCLQAALNAFLSPMPSLGQIAAMQVDCVAVWLRLQQITGTTGASLEAEASSQPNTSSAMLVRACQRTVMMAAAAGVWPLLAHIS